MNKQATIGDLFDPLKKIENLVENTRNDVQKSVEVLISTSSMINSFNELVIDSLGNIEKYLNSITNLELNRNEIERRKKKEEKPKFDGKSMKDAITVLGLLGVAVKDLAEGLIIFRFVPKKSTEKLAETLTIINESLVDVDAKKLKDGGEALLAIGEGIFKFSSLLILSVPFMVGAMVLMPLLKLFFIEFNWVLRSIDNKDTEKGLNALETLSKSLALFAISIVLLTPILIADVVALLVLKAVLSLTQWCLNSISNKETKKGAAGMALFSLSLIAFSLSLMFFMSVITAFKPKDYLTAGLVVGSVVLIFALLGEFALPILIGAAVMGVMGIALTMFTIPLLLISVALEKISKLNMPQDAFGNVIKSIVDGLTPLRDVKIFELGKDVIKIGMLTAIATGVARLGKVVSKMGKLTFPDEIDPKTGKVKSWHKMNADDIANAALNSTALVKFFTCMFGDENVTLETSNGTYTISPVSQSDLDKIMPKTRRKVARLNRIARNISKMANTIQKMAMLSFPDDFDDEGNPKGFHKMNADDIGNAALNSAAIVKFFSSLFGDEDVTLETSNYKYTFTPVSESDLDKIMPKTKRKVKRLNRIVNAISNMANTIQKMSLLVFPDEFDETTGKPKKWHQMNSDDIANAALNSAAIVTFFASLFGGVNDSDVALQTTNGTYTFTPITDSDLGNIMPRVKRKIKRLNTIVSSISNMADTLQKISLLTFPENFDETTGKPTSWHKMKASDIGDASTNIIGIIKFFSHLFGEKDVKLTFKGTEYTLTPIKESDLSSIMPRTKRKIKRLNEIISPVSNLVDVIINVSKAQIPKYDNNGNIIGYESITAKDIVNTFNTIGGIINIFVGMFNDKNKKTTIKFGGKQYVIASIVTKLNSLSQSTNGFSVVESWVNQITKMYDICKKSDNINFEKLAKGTELFFNNLSTSLENLSKPDESGKSKESTIQLSIGLMHCITRATKNDIFNKTAKGIEKISSSINKVDIKKLQGYSDLFKAASKLKDNKQFYQDLAKAVEDIKKVLEQTNNNLGDVTNQTKSINENTKNTVDIAKKAAEQQSSKPQQQTNIKFPQTIQNLTVTTLNVSEFNTNE